MAEDEIESVETVRMLEIQKEDGEDENQSVLEALVVYKSGKKDYMLTDVLTDTISGGKVWIFFMRIKKSSHFKALTKYYETLLILEYHTAGPKVRMMNPYRVANFGNGDGASDSGSEDFDGPMGKKRPAPVD